MNNKYRPITIDIQTCLGQPCIRGTDIHTRIVAARFAAGESLQALAVHYRCSLHTIEAAVRFELGSVAQRQELVEVADAGPILMHGKWYKLDRESLRW